MVTKTTGNRQTIEELSKRYETLNAQKIAAQRDLKHAQDQLEELKKKAREEYKTDDLERLKEILAEMKRKNEEDRANYQARLDQIETDLSQIEEKYSSADAGQGGF